MDLLARIRRARAVALQRGDTAAVARIDSLRPAATKSGRPTAPSWMFADDWDEEEWSGTSASPVVSAGRVPSRAELDADLTLNAIAGRAHERRIVELGRPRPSPAPARRREVHVRRDRQSLVRAAVGLIRTRINGHGKTVVRNVSADPLVVRAAIGRLGGDPKAGQDAFGTGLRRDIPLVSEQRIAATADYLSAAWHEVEARADELDGKGLHPGTYNPIPAPLSFAGMTPTTRGSVR